MIYIRVHSTLQSVICALQKFTCLPKLCLIKRHGRLQSNKISTNIYWIGNCVCNGFTLFARKKEGRSACP